MVWNTVVVFGKGILTLEQIHHINPKTFYNNDGVKVKVFNAMKISTVLLCLYVVISSMLNRSPKKRFGLILVE